MWKSIPTDLETAREVVFFIVGLKDEKICLPLLKDCCIFVSYGTTNLNKKAKSLIYFRFYTSLNPYVSKTLTLLATYFSVIFHQLKCNTTEMYCSVSQKLSSLWAVRWQMARGSTSTILSGKACGCEDSVHMQAISVLWSDFSGHNLLRCPSSDMVTYRHWGQPISSSYVCHLN